MAQAQRKSSEVFDENESEQVVSLSRKVFGRLPKRVAFPGGTSRSAFIADMGDQKYVFAKREDRHDAQIEGIVLKALADTGHVPELEALVDDWVVQTFIQGVRLPVLLDNLRDDDKRERNVSNALKALVVLHEKARSVGLHHRLPRLGTVPNWLWDRTGAAKKVSKSAGLTVPDLDREALCKAMDVKRDEFVKWDARPGNAMVTESGVVWFDWEDCGRSKALDDLAFVLCDEWSQLSAEAEARLVRSHLSAFNRSMSADQAQHYLRLFGVTHMLLRLRMATKLYHRDNHWWDRNHCLTGDKVGVTQTECARLVERLKRWSDGVPEWRGLAPWLEDVSGYYELTQ